MLVILLADGARPDTLARHLAAGALPNMAALRASGGMHTAATIFPSVTGPAYFPFLFGRFPGPLGVPGLRWYDRSRTRCRFPDYTRSYLGTEMRHMTTDIEAGAPSLFELVPSRFGALSIVTRGLRRAERLGDGPGFALRAARAHVRGDVRAWLGIDRRTGDEVVRRVARHRPALTFAAFVGPDKTSHAEGHDADSVRDALRIVDDTVGELRDATRQVGEPEIWVVSDHGHSPVHRHDDLTDVVRDAGHRAIGHPWVYGGWDVAVMVSGNAMAHLYVDRAARSRAWWPALAGRWEPLAEALLERPSVDVLVLPHGPDACEVRRRGAGRAMLHRAGATVAYRPVDGDPLGIGAHEGLDADEAVAACAAGDYPDALVQLLSLAGAARSGDLILSAARGYDFRARFEPIPHASAHGALHREHMLVPVLTNRPFARAPQRTADLMPTALRTLGVPVPPGLDGAVLR